MITNLFRPFSIGNPPFKVSRAFVWAIVSLCSALLFSTVVLSQSTTVVISEFRTRGPNGGSDEFIELYNLSASPVTIGSWKIRGSNSAGTVGDRATIPTGTILNPGCHYLLTNSSTSGGPYSGSVPGNQTYTTGITDDGGIALTLPDNTIIDQVGMSAGSAFKEGTPLTPLTTNVNRSYERKPGGSSGSGTDTNNNSNDFQLISPSDPQNLSSGCIGSPTSPTGIGLASPNSVQPGGLTLLTVAVTPGTNPTSTGLVVTGNLTLIGGSAAQAFFDDGTHGDSTAGDLKFSFHATVAIGTPAGAKSLAVAITDAQSRTGNTSITLTVQPPILAIHDIQGPGLTSPHVSEFVSTTGVVTGIRGNGFYIQMPDASVDSDTLTSEGIFIFTSSFPPAAAVIGNAVAVTGTVQEFVPSADPFSPPFTEIAGSPTVTLISTGNPLPAPNTLTAGHTSPAGSLEELERFEGMRVHVSSLTVVAPTQGFINEPNATSTTNGVFYGVITGVPRPFREPGVIVPDPLPPGSPCCVPRFDGNPERLRIDSDAQIGAAALEVTSGATVSNITGPLDYAFRTYTILPDAATPPSVSGNISAVPLPTPAADELTVGSFNMERLFDSVNDPNISEPVLTPAAFSNRLTKFSLAIRNIMHSPDIIGVQEVENLSTLQAVATKLNNDAIAASEPNPNYQVYLVEGNDVGGIDVGFLVKSSRISVIDVVQVGKDSTFINPITGLPDLLNDRPPLILRANVNLPVGSVYPVTVIVNHLRSLTDIDDAVDGPRVRAKRRAQAEFLARLIQSRQTADPDEHIVAVGDFNAFQFNDGYVDVIGTIKGTPTPSNMVVLASSDLVNPDLIELVDQAPLDQRYSFSFDGSAQVLDQVLVTQSALSRVSGFHYARVNADFPESYRNDASRPERISDHDMPVAYFKFPVQCPFGQGYWKNHPEAWIVHSLRLGTVSYSAAQLLDLLKLPVGSGKKADASIILAHKLIVAKLNLAIGAPACGTVIADVDALIGSNTIPMNVLPSSPLGRQMIAAAEKLDSCTSSPCVLPSVTTISQKGIEVPGGIPHAFLLTQNYPNPFNPSTVIEFMLRQNGYATLKVYNVLGQEVATLFEGTVDAGKVYAPTFNAWSLPSGVYWYKLVGTGKTEIKRMMLIK